VKMKWWKKLKKIQVYKIKKAKFQKKNENIKQNFKLLHF
jgi:hypothetical protein